MGQGAPQATALPTWRRIPVIVAAALVLRLAMGLPTLRAEPYSDEIVFHALATNLAAGEGYRFEPGGHLTAWRAPLWPAVMAGLYRITGPSPAAARLLQLAFGTGLVWLIIQLAAGLQPADQRVPAIAGWWAALSPTLLFHSHCLFSETLFGLVCGAGLLALLHLQQTGSWKTVVGAGLGLGLACLARGSSMLIFVVLIWLAACGPWSRAANLRQAVGVGLVTILVVLPWTVRNYLVLGGLAIVDTNGPQNFLMGNHERTPFWRPWEAPELPDRPTPQFAVEGGELAEQRASLSEGFGYLRSHPVRCAAWAVMKSANLWGLARGLASGAQSGLYGPPNLPKTLAAAAWDGLDGLALLLCGVIGMALAVERRPAGLQGLIIAQLTLIHAVTYGHSRYRFMALLLMFGFAAMTLARWRSAEPLWAGVPDRRRRAALGACGLLLAAWLYDTVGLELLWRVMT